MKVIGLDLSLTAPGLSVTGMVPLGLTLLTDPKLGDRRYCAIRDWLMHYVGTQRPRLGLVEAVPPYMSNTASLERVHGVAREVLARYDVPFAYVSPTAVKAFATGDGKADKAEVMAEVEHATGWRPPDDNAADAYVLRWMGETAAAGFDHWQGPQLQALSSIEWPLRPGDPTVPQPYGRITQRKPRTAKCRHDVVCLKVGDVWLHPFTIATCDKPPKPKR